jgi:fructose-specific PTS system IIA-like component
VQHDLKRDNIPFDPQMPIGIMLEVPGACMIVDQLSKYVDFFSIGTNDLCQYVMAVDRGNAEVSALHDVRTPAFLRLLHQTVSAASRNDTWVGVCGEMAGDPLNLPLLVGLGVNEISVPASEIAEIKAALSGLETRPCRAALEDAMALESAAEVRALLEQQVASGSLGQPAEERAGEGGPIVLESIVTDSSAKTKEDVIHELACALAAAGRTDDPRAIEEAVWTREDKGATSVGFGFAIPHGRTDAIACASIAVARLRRPVAWGGGKSGRAEGVETEAEDAGVRGAFMLVVRATDTDQSHMKMLAKLARKLMDEEFRERVLGTDDGAAILTYLRNELDLSTHRPA